MSSRTFKEDKKIRFSFDDLQEEARFGHVLSKEERKEKRKEERRANLDGYYRLKDELDALIQKAKANPKDESVKDSIQKMREEIDLYKASHPDVQSHLDWQKEEQRKASVKRQAEAIANAKRNTEPLELLKRQQEAKKAEQKADRLQKALQRIGEVKAEEQAKAKAEADAKAKAKADELTDLVAELNKTIGGYGF